MKCRRIGTIISLRSGAATIGAFVGWALYMDLHSDKDPIQKWFP